LPRAAGRPVKIDAVRLRTSSNARLILVDDDNAVREGTAATPRELR
jgi:hypothetical protein